MIINRDSLELFGQVGVTDDETDAFKGQSIGKVLELVNVQGIVVVPAAVGKDVSVLEIARDLLNLVGMVQTTVAMTTVMVEPLVVGQERIGPIRDFVRIVVRGNSQSHEI